MSQSDVERAKIDIMHPSCVPPGERFHRPMPTTPLLDELRGPAPTRHGVPVPPAPPPPSRTMVVGARGGRGQ
jgi:hypothetical protein